MKNTFAATRAPFCAPAPQHMSALSAFSGATPFIVSIEGTGVSRDRLTQVKVGDANAQGTAARGRPV
jgi:hypothetical protein